jgi:hypothetical protein
MKRDWDLIREVLIEVEALDTHTRGQKQYGVRREHPEATDAKAEQAFLLHQAGFINAKDLGSKDGQLIVPLALTWQGHELLDTMRSKPVWERIKKMSKEKGLELTFDAVRLLAKMALDAVVGNQ